MKNAIVTSFLRLEKRVLIYGYKMKFYENLKLFVAMCLAACFKNMSMKRFDLFKKM
jgi:hypothetical protein